jgi:predicted GNAT family acetyltransferase
VPSSCATEIVDDGGALLAVVRDGAADIVSSARLVACGRFGVIDRVRTRLADRRRGLGRAVMTMLGNRALDDGLTTGLLSATADGQALYSALGWVNRGELAGAFRS